VTSIEKRGRDFDCWVLRNVGSRDGYLNNFCVILTCSPCFSSLAVRSSVFVWNIEI
jgi:hypothetical protein